MPLRIAFDVDGVLADMTSELARLTEQLFGGGIRRPPDRQRESMRASHPRSSMDEQTTHDATAETNRTPRRSLKGRQQRDLWRHVASIPSFWESLTEVEPGAVAKLASMATTRRWEVIFLTKRPDSAGPPAQRQTQRWLESCGYAHPSVFVVNGTRGRIAAALDLDVVVDDTPENCLDVLMDSKTRPVLVWRNEKRLPPAPVQRSDIYIANSTMACMSILADLDDSLRQSPKRFDRVMQRLGLKRT